jgi:phage-related baseplate assembly protein
LNNILNGLPSITFAEKDAQKIESDIITAFEAIAERTLYPGDPVRLFLETIAAIIVQQRTLIDYAAKQNLLAYSAGDNLGHIGVLVGTTRIAATAATTTLRFTLSAVQPTAITIPAGTRAATEGGLTFATSSVATVAIGSTYVDVAAVCTQIGAAGNDLAAGQINKIVDPIAYVASVANTTTSEGGADIEADDDYRERIRLAPESFSVAGPTGAYVYWAKSASSLIVDVSVTSPNPGEVEIRPLLTGGELPDTELLAAVDAVVNDVHIRPLTDQVTVLAPTAVSYDVNLTYYVAGSNSALATSIQAAVAAAVTEYVLWQKSALGRDINPSELIARIMAAGAKRVAVTTPVFAVVDAGSVAVADTITVTYGGLENG